MTNQPKRKITIPERRSENYHEDFETICLEVERVTGFKVTGFDPNIEVAFTKEKKLLACHSLPMWFVKQLLDKYGDLTIELTEHYLGYEYKEDA